MTTRIDQYILKLLVDHIVVYEINIAEYEFFGCCGCSCMDHLFNARYLFNKNPKGIGKVDSWSDFPKLSLEERAVLVSEVDLSLKDYSVRAQSLFRSRLTEDKDKNDKLYLDAYGLNFIDARDQYFEFYDPHYGSVGAEFFMRCISHRYYETITKFQAVIRKKQSMVKTIRNLHLTGSV